MISVVIPALDEAENISGAIESALSRGGLVCGVSERRAADDPESAVRGAGVRGSSKGATPEIDVWVVDGGSRDDTVARAEAIPGVRILGPPPGLEESGAVHSGARRAAQLQAGLEASSGEVVLFLHADTRLPRGWRQAVEAALADPDVCGGAFRFAFRAASGASLPQRVALALVARLAQLRTVAFGLPYGDQALFFRRSLLEAVGGVPQVPLMEDLDLVARARRHGRLVSLRLPAPTSPRRHLRDGVLRTALRHVAALLAWKLGADRHRLAARVRR